VKAGEEAMRKHRARACKIHNRKGDRKMKTNLFRTSIVAVIAAAAAYAQSSSPIKADVPFDFVAGNQTLKAGQYIVNLRIAPGTMHVKSADHGGGVFLMGSDLRSVTTQGQGKLVFYRYGNTYFLSEVWSAEDYGRQLPKSRRERELTARGPAAGATTIAAIR
jgi:hypothetical protein